MAFIDESEIEGALLEQFVSLGYSLSTDDEIGPDGSKPERSANNDVVLQARLRAAVLRLNPRLPEEAREDAIRKVLQSELPSLIEENRRVHRLLAEGVDVEYYAEDGTIAYANVSLLDFERLDANDWLSVSQMTVISGQHQRRPDVVVYLNGLPIAVIELKAPGNDGATLAGAFNQLQTYKNEIGQLFRTNALSDIRRIRRAHRLAIGRSRALYAVANDNGRGGLCEGGARTFGAHRRSIRKIAFAFADSRFHGVLSERERHDENHRGLPSISCSEKSGGFDDSSDDAVVGYARRPRKLRLAERRVATVRRQKSGRDLAYAGFGQKLFDGVLCRATRATSGDAESDDCRAHGSQRFR
jgi:hypothetical protein